jgi:hypothetical protein
MISLITFIIVVVLVGLLLWAVEKFVPMDPAVKRFLQIAVIIILVLWLVSSLGLLTNVNL